jgi:hypothetical protein
MINSHGKITVFAGFYFLFLEIREYEGIPTLTMLIVTQEIEYKMNELLIIPFWALEKD